MIKSKLFRYEWEAKLRSLGCEPLEGYRKQRKGEFWRYPDQRRYPFFVPYEDDETMDGWALIRLVDDITGRKGH